MLKNNPALYFLLLLFLVFSLNKGNAQTITIQQSQISVKDILQEITTQTGLNFSYNPRAVDIQKRIDFFVKNASLEETLNQLAKQIPIAYSLVERQIVLNYSEAKLELEYFTISGFLTDKSSGETLSGASVFVRAVARGTSTNAFGFYSLRLPKGLYVVEYSYIGFDTEAVNLQLESDAKKDMTLGYVSLDLPDVLVKTPLSDLLDKKQLSVMEMAPSGLGDMPEFAGESGLIKGLETLPGIKTHSDGSAFFFTRGGEKDQNLIIIDDAPVYNPAHLFGFYSMVIPDFTKSINVYKSDIPVNLGDRLSSIIDIRTKDGNLNHYELTGAFNPLLFRFSMEGPIVKEKSSFFVSFRQSTFQWLYLRTNPEVDVRFNDFSVKWNYRFNPKSRLFFTVFRGTDVFANNDLSSGIGWSNFAATIRWNQIFNPKLFSNTILYTGNYQYELFSGDNKWYSGIAKLSIKSDFTYYPTAKLTSRFGAELHGYYFNPGQVITDQESFPFFPSIEEDYSRQSVLYLNADYKLADNWRVKAGVRMPVWENLGPATYYTFDDDYEVLDSTSVEQGPYQRYWNVDPRLSLQHHLDSTSSLKLSYGLYHQYLQLISNSASPFTSMEVWLPSSPTIKPQRAQQLTLGYLKYFPDAKIDIRAEAYYKKMNNQIDYEPHANILVNPLLEGELRFGKTRSYGLELFVKKDFGKLSGWLSYTYSKTLRQTNGVNGDREYPAFHDRPHDFSILLNYKINAQLLLSAYWTAYTGSTFSSPTGFYTFNEQTVPIYSEKNNDRLPNYNRLDLALKYVLNKNPENKYQHSLTFSIYNALAHKNVVAVNFNKVLDAEDKPIVQANLLGSQNLVSTQADLIRFFPSLTYKFGLNLKK